VKSLRMWHLAALLTLTPMAASAQFTTYIAPAKPKVTPAEVVAMRTDSVRTDSIRPRRLTDMKAWVDSAAGSIAAAPPAVTDTSRGEVVAPVTRPARPAPKPSSTFREGAAAPNTASPLPGLAVLGTLMIGLGLWLSRKRPETIACVARSDES
jgi:LPXTG-motif cell wall-anchored protein